MLNKINISNNYKNMLYNYIKNKYFKLKLQNE